MQNEILARSPAYTVVEQVDSYIQGLGLVPRNGVILRSAVLMRAMRAWGDIKDLPDPYTTLHDTLPGILGLGSGQALAILDGLQQKMLAMSKTS